jgi:HK97 family phage prohead protease
METLPNLEVVRDIAQTVRTKAAEPTEGASSVMPTMEVRFSRYGKWYEIDSFWEGNFMERTDLGAFAKTIAESRSQIRSLFNHGFDPQIGQKVLGDITDLREEPDSPVGEVPLFDTSYNHDLLPGLEAGVYGSSMRMRVVKDEWNDDPGISEHNPKGLPERTIKEVRLFEFGPVTFPANPESTAGIRSATDDYYTELRSRDPEKVAELMRSRDSLISLHRLEQPAPATVEDERAEKPAAEPDAPHDEGAAPLVGLTPGARRERLHPFLKGSAA